MGRTQIMTEPCKDCGRVGLPHRGRGLCSTCYSRWLRDKPAIADGDPVFCTNPDCGAQMLQPSTSGMCGFCEEEMAA